MWSLFVLLAATEWYAVILETLISMNLHQPLESEYLYKYSSLSKTQTLNFSNFLIVQTNSLVSWSLRTIFGKKKPRDIS